MNIQSTKTMAKFLNKNLSLKCVESIGYHELSRREYELNVNFNSYENENDYLINKDKFRVLKVNYIWQCYAYPKYLTTNTLIKLFRTCENKTVDGFIEAIERAIEI